MKVLHNKKLTQTYLFKGSGRIKKAGNANIDQFTLGDSERDLSLGNDLKQLKAMSKNSKSSKKKKLLPSFRLPSLMKITTYVMIGVIGLSCLTGCVDSGNTNVPQEPAPIEQVVKDKGSSMVQDLMNKYNVGEKVVQAEELLKKAGVEESQIESGKQVITEEAGKTGQAIEKQLTESADRVTEQFKEEANKWIEGWTKKGTETVQKGAESLKGTSAYRLTQEALEKLPDNIDVSQLKDITGQELSGEQLLKHLQESDYTKAQIDTIMNQAQQKAEQTQEAGGITGKILDLGSQFLKSSTETPAPQADSTAAK